MPTTEKLYELMESKLRLLTELHALAIQQSDLVSGQELSELMSLLGRKQRLMDTLMEIQVDLVPYASEDPEERIWRSEERRRECQAIKTRCDRLVGELLVMENRAIDNMALQREVVASQLQQVTDASRLSRAYEASSGGGFQADGGALSYTG